MRNLDTIETLETFVVLARLNSEEMRRETEAFEI